MKRLFFALAAALGLLWLGGTPARAGNTPTDVNWQYNFTPGQTAVNSDSGAGSVTFTNEPLKGATNSSDVVVTNLRVSSAAAADSPDTLTSSGAWKVTLQLTDSSGDTTSMTFTGKLSGTFSKYNADITNQFTGKTSYTWTAPDSGNTYVVTMVGYTPPGPPNASNAGSIAAFVQVTPAGGGGHTSGAPEPSSLVLSCVGLGFAGLTTWRKRRRSLAAMLA